MDSKLITVLIEQSIPQFIRIEYPTFVEFIKLYYEFQENLGEAYHFLANMQDFADVDRTTLDYLENFSKQFLASFPKNILGTINKRTLIKFSREYYQSIGSEASIKFLFRIMFNEDITLYYPTVDILRVSDGKWQNDFIIKVTNSNLDDSIVDLEGTEIHGEQSNAVGLVDKVTTYTASNGAEVAELSIVEINPTKSIQSFMPEEFITGVTLNTGLLIRERIFYILSDINITSNNLYNAAGDIIFVESTVGVDAFLVVKSVESGSIESMQIISGGAGYSVDDIITFSSTSGRNARAIVTSVDGSGAITEITMKNNGYNYKNLPSYTIITSGGSGAILYPVSSTIGLIRDVQIINFGVGYVPDAGSGFPYTFPISFSTSFDSGTLLFNTNIIAFDTSWNAIDYEVGNVLLGLTSGARGVITRVDQNSGVFSIRPLNEFSFDVGEIIADETTGASGYQIHLTFTSSGTLAPGALGNYDGYFANTDGFLSSDKYIQDSYYYQDFSYVINTLRPRADWINTIKNNVHPAGTIVFGFGEGETIIGVSSFGGWVGPVGSSIDFYRITWNNPTQYDDGSIASLANTRISTIADEVIYKSVYLDPALYPDIIEGEPINTLYKTNICYGSKVLIET